MFKTVLNHTHTRLVLLQPTRRPLARKVVLLLNGLGLTRHLGCNTIGMELFVLFKVEIYSDSANQTEISTNFM